MSGVRPLRRDDIPAVAALRARAFARSRLGADDLEAHLAKVFLENPWQGDDVQSLVHVSGSGAVDGFLGLVPRPLLKDDRPLRGAAAAQFMVAPESRGLPGLRLYRAAFELPVDLLFTDTATPDATLLWEHMGGAAARVYGVTWSVPCRPEFLPADRATSAVERAARAVAGPLMRAAGRFRRTRPLEDGVRLEPLSGTDVVRHAAEFARGRLRARYDERTWDWVLEVLRSSDGDAVACISVHRDRELIGWFVIRSAVRESTFLYQLVARRGHEETVLQAALQHAQSRGALVLQGRFDRDVMETVARLGGRADYHGRGILVHTGDSAIMQEVLSGSAALTGLEGEWWMGF